MRARLAEPSKPEEARRFWAVGGPPTRGLAKGAGNSESVSAASSRRMARGREATEAGRSGTTWETRRESRETRRGMAGNPEGIDSELGKGGNARKSRWEGERRIVLSQRLRRQAGAYARTRPHEAALEGRLNLHSVEAEGTSRRRGLYGERA